MESPMAAPASPAMNAISVVIVVGLGLGKLVLLLAEDCGVLLSYCPAEILFYGGEAAALHGSAHANQLLVGQLCSKRVHVVLRWGLRS